MILLSEITKFLDYELPPDNSADASINGLQVDNNGQIDRVYLAVDASWETLQKAENPSNALFFVHHGLFWKKQELRICGSMKKKISFFIEHNAALYASHLPLDNHPAYGNNSLILNHLGITQNVHPFGNYHGLPVGLWGDFEQLVSIQDLVQKIAAFSPLPIQLLQGSKKAIKRVAVVTGSGCDFVHDANMLKADLFITGEFSLQSYTYAMEEDLNVLYLTHYGSEKWGVIKFGEVINATFSLECQFLEVCPKIIEVQP
jgi:dinuclear metal center YbgI/SA1388 family protein